MCSPKKSHGHNPSRSISSSRRRFAAGSSDDLDATVDYGSVVETVRKLVETSHFQLLESLADTIAEAVLTDSRIDAVTVWVRKLRPPLAADVETVGVRITRGRDDTLRPQR